MEGRSTNDSTRSRGCRPLAGVLLFLGCTLLAGSGAAQREELPVDDVTAVLLEGVANAEAEETTRLLVALGPGSLPQLFQILVEGKYTIRIGDLGTSKKALAPHQELALLGAFEHSARAATLGFFAGLVGGESVPRERERIVGLRVLGSFATTGELPLLVSLASPAPRERRVPRKVRKAFADAVGTLLDRDEHAAVAVRRAFPDLPPPLVAPLVDALGQRPSHGRLLLLSQLLGEVPEIDAYVLVALGRVAHAVRRPLDERVAHAVRGYLTKPSSQVLVEASVAAAGLEDTEAFPLLIGLLEHPDRNVRTRAHQALESIAGRRMSGDPVRWTQWHGKQLTWWEEAAPDEFRALRSGEIGLATRLVLELSKRTFFRHRLTEPLAAGLRRQDDDFVVLTCSTLGHLGSWTAVPHLIPSLEHRNEDVRAAAWRALRRITGAELGVDPEPWRELHDRHDLRLETKRSHP